MESWQSDTASSYHTRKRYKERIIQKRRDEAAKKIIIGDDTRCFHKHRTQEIFEDDELHIPTKMGDKIISAALSMLVLRNKEDIVLEMLKPMS